jgi:hypothetical protein
MRHAFIRDSVVGCGNSRGTPEIFSCFHTSFVVPLSDPGQWLLSVIRPYAEKVQEIPTQGLKRGLFVIWVPYYVEDCVTVSAFCPKALLPGRTCVHVRPDKVRGPSCDVLLAHIPSDLVVLEQCGIQAGEPAVYGLWGGNVEPVDLGTDLSGCQPWLPLGILVTVLARNVCYCC